MSQNITYTLDIDYSDDLQPILTDEDIKEAITEYLVENTNINVDDISVSRD